MRKSRFDLTNKYALITGGGGLLGPEHGIALASCGASIILVDIDHSGLENARSRIFDEVPDAVIKLFTADITDENSLVSILRKCICSGISIDILVNNAAINPKMKEENNLVTGDVEHYDMQEWQNEINVGITGTFLCSKVFGSEMAKNGYGVIVNIASDLAISAPDHRVYTTTENISDVKHFKPIGYVVTKTAMIGMTRYLATYWAHKGIRVNALVPGAVFNSQPEYLVRNISNRVPLQRMANKDEYREALLFLASEASSYMTGQMLVVDGGRSIW